MGLIKTAILAGGGIYAVNKLAKASENRHNQQQQQQPYYPPQNPQQNPHYGQGPQGQQQNGYYAQNAQYNGSQQQRQWEPQGPSQYQDGKGNNPPPYYQQQQQSYTQGKN
jgi:annexin A7/11